MAEGGECVLIEACLKAPARRGRTAADGPARRERQDVDSPVTGMEFVWMPAGQVHDGQSRDGSRPFHQRDAAPGDLDQGLLDGQVRGHAGAVEAGHGQQPVAFKNAGDKAPVENVTCGHLPSRTGFTAQAQRACQGERRAVPPADGGGMGVRVPGGDDRPPFIHGPLTIKGAAQRSRAGRDCLVRRQQRRELPRGIRYAALDETGSTTAPVRNTSRGREEAQRLGPA